MWFLGAGGSMIVHVAAEENYLAMDDKTLLSQCSVQAYRSSGPGGQHRNKVSSAVRLKHLPTGITVHADQSRSQHQNKQLAVGRLRMNIACKLRGPIDTSLTDVPAVVAGCIFTPRGRGAGVSRRLEIGRKDHRFWAVGAFLLDVLESFDGKIAAAAEFLGITTSNLAGIFKSDRHLFAAAQAIRRDHGQRPLK